eukprot:CAMPEP_0206215130 /NCGR_PEP_ID=MMETSP0047_2-20121206/2029_1 /ASSEMBLY_ACC=CAM_ASM_000192 /TAXON_ID=195065 /ORGANISM="Chroomonas mesostigmatica_cf, Strain CCMP1168" /LENGTH=358 /DNA_ID=CAMNT_0053637401 /DNA_START=28 /DNA_END=1104 /DNA_ORIENTATION=+
MTLSAPRRTVLAEDSNAHLPLQGYANTDSSLECLPCLSGPHCRSGCVAVSKQSLAAKHAKLHQAKLHKTHQLAGVLQGGGTVFQGHPTSVPLGAHPRPRAFERYGVTSAMPNLDGPHCPGGHCEPLEKRGVRVDAWGLGHLGRYEGMDGAQRMIPLLVTDPAAHAAVEREMAQRQGRYKRYDYSHMEGVHTPSVNWGPGGALYSFSKSKGRIKLERAGVNVNNWPASEVIPLPFFDKGWFNEKGEWVDQEKDRSNERLEKRGVNVDAPRVNPRVRAKTLDDLPDHMVTYQPVPKYRDYGVARQEEPLNFMLRDEKRLAEPQPVYDRHEHVEWDWNTEEGVNAKMRAAGQEPKESSVWP